MKVELKEGENRYQMTVHELYVNDKLSERISDLSECPEDAHIGRDLVDGNDIISYIKMAYEAGKNGEELEIVYSDID